ncbi:MAG: hypothetical protein HYU36_15560 [Planctomycetes bacterium]|nr:hypothetical protein [Planctomycetota bacterium]
MTLAVAKPDIHGQAFQSLSDRIRVFRDQSRRRAAGKTWSPRDGHFKKAFFEIYAEKPYEERYARSLAYALENEPVYLFPDEHLVGMLYQTPTEKGPRDEIHDRLWQSYSPGAHIRARQEQEIEPYLRVGGAPGHVGWRWDWILEQGIEGHVNRIRRLLAGASDERARALYHGAVILWESVLKWNDLHRDELARSLRDARGPDRARIERLIALCSRVPRYPARTFHEALQSFHFQHLALMFENPFGGNGPGRLDTFLWPHLKRDLDRGGISLEQARDLIDELFIRFHERLFNADGWVEAVMVGGVHPDGSDAVNPLSYIVVHSIKTLDQTHPSIYVRLSRKSPESFTDLSVRYLLEGGNRAQIYSDEACLEALVRGGIPIEDAAQYMAGGCMEISVQGMNCDLNFACITNVAKTLELVLHGGVDLLTSQRRIVHERDLTAYRDFEELYAAFEGEMAREYDVLARALDIASESYARYRPCCLLSSLMADCLARGREQQDGGARYHDYGFAPLGITSAADSLHAIEKAVYREGFVSASDLLDALRSNFQGCESLRARLGRLPKFGMEHPDADAMCNRVLRSVCTLAARTRTRFGGRLKPMVFNFVWTPSASRELGARADGSLAGDLIGHGLTPRSCAMTKGITAAMNSTLSLDFEVVSGGATTMWDMDDQWIDFSLMKALLRTYLDRGGMIFQGNTTSVKELEDALEHPENYPNLIVRVGGFSARFITLSRELQQEIVTRRRHAR